MKPENLYYEVTPRVVPANQESTVEIVPKFAHSQFNNNTKYAVSYYPVEEFSDRSGWQIGYPQAQAKFAGGTLRITQYFEGEQEHVLFVEAVDGLERKPIADFRVYSVEKDLWGRRPFKGDIHLHSCESDGRDAPAYVAGACRRIGLDFMALTDHRKYAPSLEAQRAFNGVDIDLHIYPGEEVHPPESPVHIIHFGGRFSVNELFQNAAANTPYRAEVQAIQEKLGVLPRGVDPYQYASCVWSFDKIREAGGLGVFCHPYWFTEHRYSPSGALTSYLFEQAPFDAFEVIGGFHRYEADSNTLQVARYHEERAQGRRVPIVGVSDAHGCERDELFGWYYTIVFSPSLEFDDLADSIRQLYSVAVEALPGETPRAYGPFRLVKFALFLMREILPQHDALCFEEGRIMLEHVVGNGAAAAALRTLKGRTSQFLDQCYAAHKKTKMRSKTPKLTMKEA